MAQPGLIRLLLVGDVMIGRGIDQILPVTSHPELHESAITDARDYVWLAERANGTIPRGVGYEYVWGDALDEMRRAAPDLRVVNLETSITRSDDWQPKGINYRMRPENVTCLTAAHVDCADLANNHVLDYGRDGFVETLSVLHGAGVKTAGAGANAAEARAPAVLPVGPATRVLVLGIGSRSSGIPPEWGATEHRPGVNLWDGPVARTTAYVREALAGVRRPGDVVVASLHWGENFGYAIPERHRTLARALIDECGVDVIHGHSSHHVKGIEVYRNKLVLHGCGDFIDDYEGISGHEAYRGDLSLMYFVDVDGRSGSLNDVRMVPMRIRRFRLERASAFDARWLAEMLNREGASFRTSVGLDADGALRLRWH
ncbi:MAG TPA: CapA family protein [Polyangiaceae bacterium]|nr:CapA family protein [Polyangiaceae bacterium]